MEAHACAPSPTYRTHPRSHHPTPPTGTIRAQELPEAWRRTLFGSFAPFDRCQWWGLGLVVYRGVCMYGHLACLRCYCRDVETIVRAFACKVKHYENTCLSPRTLVSLEPVLAMPPPAHISGLPELLGETCESRGRTSSCTHSCTQSCTHSCTHSCTQSCTHSCAQSCTRLIMNQGMIQRMG